MTTYRIEHVSRMAEQDSYEHGCIGPSTEYGSNGYKRSGTDLAKLITDAFRFVDLPADYVYVSSVAEDRTYIGANRQETADGTDPTPSELDRFKAGELDLYLVDYTFALSIVTHVTPAVIGLALPGATIEGGPDVDA